MTRACERSGAAKFPAHRSAAFTGVPLTAPLPLRSKAGFKGEVRAPDLLTIRGPSTTPADFFSFLEGRYLLDS